MTTQPPRTGNDRRRRASALPLARGLAALLLLAAAAAPAGASQERAPAELVRALESRDLAEREAARAALARAGLEGAQAALAGFRDASPAARAERAAVLRAGGEGSLLEAVLELGDERNPRVRAELARFLAVSLRAHPRPSRALAARVCELLRTWAAEDAAGEGGSAALEALARADLDAAVLALARLAREGTEAQAALAASALASSPRGGPQVLALVQASFDPAGPRLSEPALAVLLAQGYGQALAERDGGGLEARERAPLALGRTDPSAAIAAASTLALEGFLGRASFLGAGERAERTLAALADELADPLPVLLASALLTLRHGDDPARALAPLERALLRLGPARREDPRGRFELAVVHTLAAATQVACGRPAAATPRLELARTLLAGLAGEGLERTGAAGAQLASEVAGERAVVESHALLALLRQGTAPDAPACRALARAVHESSLRAQLLQTAGPLESWTGDLDTLAHHSHGPFDLLLGNPRLQAGLGALPSDLALALGRALAAVAPEELPGFAPEGGAEALDEARAALLGQIEIARLEQLERELRRLPADHERRPELENALRVLGAELSPEPDLHRVRLPSSLAIELAGDLRDEGRCEEAAAICAQAKTALERSDFLFGAPHVQETIARAESIVGSCHTDAGDPRRADEVLNQALARLETLARTGLDDVRSKAVRSNVLVSLAVNANVKLGDPAKALAYFERAFELRQDDFTRTLLACYRARAGRDEEARALLREMPESPHNAYNLACTHALLGERELALEYLERELRPGTKAAGALERQRVWARSDPDLSSLREDPRFRALVGP